jgi:hypothetical protein
MPAPSSASIQNFLTQAFIAQGLTLKTFDGNGNVVDSGQLTPDTQKLVRALSVGIAAQWEAWQSAQPVAVTGVSTGGGSAPGTLP